MQPSEYARPEALVETDWLRNISSMTGPASSNHMGTFGSLCQPGIIRDAVHIDCAPILGFPVIRDYF